MRRSIQGFTLLIALLFSACAVTTQLPSTQPVKAAVQNVQIQVKKAQQSTTEAQKSASAAQAKITQLEKLVANQKAELTLAQEVKSDVDALTAELSQTQIALKTAYDGLNDANGKVDTLQKKLDADQKVLDRAVKTEIKYHRLKWSICALAAGFVGLAMWHFLGAFLLPFGIAGIAGLAAPSVAVFAYLMFKL